MGEHQSIAQKGVRAIDARKSQLESDSNATKNSVRAPGLSTHKREHLLCDTLALADLNPTPDLVLTRFRPDLDLNRGIHVRSGSQSGQCRIQIKRGRSSWDGHADPWLVLLKLEPYLGVPKPVVSNLVVWKRSFALLRPFADLLLRSFTFLCAHLHVSASDCV